MKSLPLPKSPDLNPIEYLWGDIKRILFKLKVIQIWDEFPQEKNNSLVLSFKKRLKLVLAKNGESISEELRQGLKKLPDDDIQISNDTDLHSFDEIIEIYDLETDDSPIQLQSKRHFLLKKIYIFFELLEYYRSFFVFNNSYLEYKINDKF